MSLTLKRIAILTDGAFGVLMWHGVPFAVTCERTEPDLRGIQLVKIPQGIYACKRDKFIRGGYESWLVTGGVVTPERRILFHKGNYEMDSEGCILVGEKFEPLNGRLAIQQSGDGFSNLMALTRDYNEVSLSVINL